VDVYSSRTGSIRASTPSSDGASSPVRLQNEDDDWENITRDTSQISSLDVSEVVKDPQSSRVHTSDYHSTGKPLIVSLALPSSADPNDSWIKAFGGKVQITDPPVDLTSSPSRQVAQLSRLGQYATPYPPTTSVPFRPHDSARGPPTAHYPSPGTPTSDLTSSLPLSETGPSFRRVMNHRGESGSDLSSVYPPSLCTSPMFRNSPSYVLVKPQSSCAPFRFFGIISSLYATPRVRGRDPTTSPTIAKCVSRRYAIRPTIAPPTTEASIQRHNVVP